MEVFVGYSHDDIKVFVKYCFDDKFIPFLKTKIESEGISL